VGKKKVLLHDVAGQTTKSGQISLLTVYKNASLDILGSAKVYIISRLSLWRRKKKKLSFIS
jgi:hypothetical protein